MATINDLKVDWKIPRQCGVNYDCIAINIVTNYNKAKIVRNLGGLEIKHLNRFEKDRGKRIHIFWTEEDGEFYHIIRGFGPATGRMIDSYLTIQKLQNHKIKIHHILYNISAYYNFELISHNHSLGSVKYWRKIRNMSYKKNSKVDLLFDGKSIKGLNPEDIYDNSYKLTGKAEQVISELKEKKFKLLPKNKGEYNV